MAQTLPARAHVQEKAARGVAFVIPGEAVPFARAGAKGKVRFTPAKQKNFMADVKVAASGAMAGEPPIEGALAVTIRATYLHPVSWSPKKRDRTRFKTSKPDVDNIAKIIKDAMSTIVFADDAQVAELSAQKVYGLRAETVVTVMSLEASA